VASGNLPLNICNTLEASESYYENLLEVYFMYITKLLSCLWKDEALTRSNTRQLDRAKLYYAGNIKLISQLGNESPVYENEAIDLNNTNYIIE
jgi:hypothetical protein